MALPKIETTTFKVTIPSNGVEVMMRPMTIREEKILLTAKQGETETDIIQSMIQVVNNCIIDENINLENLAYFDIEWMFLQLRANSVSNIVKLSYRDAEDITDEHPEGVEHEFEVDLNKVKPPKPTNDGKVDLENGIALVLKYPAIKMYTTTEYEKADEQGRFAMVLRNAIDKIWEGETVHDPKNSSVQEIDQFVDSIPSKQFEKINKFFDEQPSMKYEIKYKNSSGEEKEIFLTTLSDFFSF